MPCATVPAIAHMSRCKRLLNLSQILHRQLRCLLH